MALLLPCQNEISAHLLRSRLLSHGIPSDVVQDNFATAYGNWLTRPHLLISEEALEDGLELLAVPEEPLDETFTEPAETIGASEDLGLHSDVPEVSALVIFGFKAGCLLGVVLLILITLFAIAASGGGGGGSGAGIFFVFLPLWCGLYGSVFGLVCWPFIILARSCRHRDDGLLPFRARVIWLFNPQFPFLGALLTLVAIIIQMLLGLDEEPF